MKMRLVFTFEDAKFAANREEYYHSLRTMSICSDRKKNFFIKKFSRKKFLFFAQTF